MHRPITIHIGGVHASLTPVQIHTVLGSCVAACLFDRGSGIGGMNHFMLPGHHGEAESASRYGINAMELLINDIMKLGGDRRRLEAKVFGGADLFGFQGLRIGTANAEFVRTFLDTERIPIVSRRLGGNHALSVHFFTHTARAMVQVVRSSMAYRLVAEEQRASERFQPPAGAGDDITLF